MQLIKVSDILVKSRLSLKESGIKSWNSDALLLLVKVCNLTKEQIIFGRDLEIDEVVAQKYLEAIDLRAKSMPVAKIIGKKDFFESSFVVSQHVLDPRPDSETLIETVLAIYKDQNQDFEILELGVGSGCLILSLLKLYNNAKAYGVDISQLALETAKKNAKNLQVDDRINFVESDLFSQINQKFDLIISNPPYIPTKELKNLDLDVAYDPIIALDGGVDGLDFYRKIAKEAKDYLKKDGKIIVEIGFEQHLEVKDIFGESGFLCIKESKDLAQIIRVLIFSLC